MKIFNKDHSYKLLEDYSNAFGISGYEDALSKLYVSQVKNAVDSIEKDNLGSTIAVKRGTKNGPSVMLAAHMDEIGFLVRKVEKGGFLRIHPVGGWWGHVLLGKRVNVHAHDGKIYVGVVGSTPPHILKPSERANVLPVSDMYVDLGLDSDTEVEKLQIGVGCMVTKTSKTFRMANSDFVCGKSMDDRACLAMMTEAVQGLADEKLGCDLYAVATVQEEVGLRGAQTAAQHLEPDIALALDVTIAMDQPGMKESGTKLGGGIAISVMDSSVIGNPKLIRYLQNLAEKENIKFDYDLLAGGGTDAGTIHKAGSGVITVTLSLPSRYIHSHNEIVHLEDFKNGVKLIQAFLKSMNAKSFKELKNLSIA